MTIKISFFNSPAEFRNWLLKNHDKVPELWVGFYKKHTSIPGITYKEALDQVLCFDWIDGVRQSIDEISYKIRFTPRKPKSIWSAVNIRRIKELIKLGLVHSSGLNTFNGRDKKKTNLYSFEQRTVNLHAAYKKKFKKNKKAWDFYQLQAPWYKKVTTWWIMSAKNEDTRLRRLNILIGDSMNRKKLEMITKYITKKIT